MEGFAFTTRARDGERLRVLSQVREAAAGAASLSRSVYLRVKRSELLPVLTMFDARNNLCGQVVADVLAGEVASLTEVAAWARHLPHEGAVARALNPHPERTDEIEFMRAIEFRLRVLDWRMAKGKRFDAPEPIRFPWDPPPAGSWIGDAHDWDDAVERFGKVMPKDYKRVLRARAAAERDGRDVNEAIMEAAHG